VEEYRNPNNQTETFRISKEITHLLKECEKVESSRVTALREKVAIYFSKIKALHTRDWIIEKNNLGELKSGGIVFNYFIFLLFSPIWLFGLITNYVPYKVPYVIAKKVAKNIEWQASVNATIAAFLWQFYWLAQSLVVALVFRNWYLLGAFMLLVPITGMLAQELYVLVKKANGARKFLLMKNSSEVGEVQKMRNEIVEEVELLKAKFPLGAD